MKEVDIDEGAQLRRRDLLMLTGSFVAGALLADTPMQQAKFVEPKQDKLNFFKAEARSLGFEMRKVIRKLRESTGVPIDPKLDPHRTGIVGVENSRITSIKGTLLLKQAATHPDWAEVAVEKLWSLGVRPNDKIAVTWTGSIPGANIALAAAIKAMNLDAVAISSLSSSQFGANIENMSWLHMETALHEKGLLAKRSIAVSRGGLEDAALEFKDNIPFIDQLIKDLGYEHLGSKSTAEGFLLRLNKFAEQVDGDFSQYAAFLSAGGSSACIGGDYGMKIQSDAIYTLADLPNGYPTCVLTEFLKLGVPALNFRWIFQMHMPKEYKPQQADIERRLAKKLQEALSKKHYTIDSNLEPFQKGNEFILRVNE